LGPDQVICVGSRAGRTILARFRADSPAFGSVILTIAGILTGGYMKPQTATQARQAAIDADYRALSGRWQLVWSVVDGKPVPEDEVRKTVLITKADTFSFPDAQGVATSPQGTFTINPQTRPHQVDSTALAGPNKGKITRGIYEVEGDHKQACWGSV